MAFEHLTKKELLQKMESLCLGVTEHEKAGSDSLYREKLYKSLTIGLRHCGWAKRPRL